MPAAPMPWNEDARCAALAECNILDTPPEAVFDELTRSARALCDTPAALVSLVDADRQWFKSHDGIAANQTPRGVSFCSYVVFTQSTLVIEDATHDSRVSDSPLVIGDPHIRAYAGVPLTVAGGLTLGALCVVDHKVRYFTGQQIAGLQALAGRVIAELELRRKTAGKGTV